MSKTKKAQRAIQHTMQAMHHNIQDLTRNGFSASEAIGIVGDAALARMCVMLNGLVGGSSYEANQLFGDVKDVLYRHVKTSSNKTAPAADSVLPPAEIEPPVRPTFEPDVPEPARFLEQENEPEQETPKRKTAADILYPKR